MSKEDVGQTAEETIDLKEPGLAAFLAWLVPGLGHWYQGRRAKAALYFVCIMGLFSYGVYLSSSNDACRDGTGTIGYGRAVYFSFRDGDWRLSYLGQVGVGLPSLPALLQASRMSNHRKVWWGGFMAPAAAGDGRAAAIAAIPTSISPPWAICIASCITISIWRVSLPRSPDC